MVNQAPSALIADQLALQNRQNANGSRFRPIVRASRVAPPSIRLDRSRSPLDRRGAGRRDSPYPRNMTVKHEFSGPGQNQPHSSRNHITVYKTEHWREAPLAAPRASALLDMLYGTAAANQPTLAGAPTVPLSLPSFPLQPISSMPSSWPLNLYNLPVSGVAPPAPAPPLPSVGGIQNSTTNILLDQISQQSREILNLRHTLAASESRVRENRRLADRLKEEKQRAIRDKERAQREKEKEDIKKEEAEKAKKKAVQAKEEAEKATQSAQQEIEKLKKHLKDYEMENNEFKLENIKLKYQIAAKRDFEQFLKADTLQREKDVLQKNLTQSKLECIRLTYQLNAKNDMANLVHCVQANLYQPGPSYLRQRLVQDWKEEMEQEKKKKLEREEKKKLEESKLKMDEEAENEGKESEKMVEGPEEKLEQNEKIEETDKMMEATEE
ncbi:hypothetical protein L596_001195 [Steinernema carpocapsae]|uniref:Uncharacterized protein n=1 Tax=Steinernema carpocapsae TaxID=34508 RepID=A0A4U8UN17_STECR|nr:hypothetical protein L596_001195 [Steinernema carpocapsae]